MSEYIQFNIPLVGRFVSGSLTHKRTKDFEGRPIPEEEQRIEFGVAYEKQAFWQWLSTSFYQEVLTPAIGANQAAMGQVNQWFSSLSGFSMKITDGDKPGKNGVNPNTVGHFVVWFSSIDTPQCVAGEAYAQIPAEDVKRGFYVTMAGNVKYNGQTGDRAGIYINATNVWLRAEGDVIAGQIDAETAFAGLNTAAPALPAGARPLGTASGAGAAFGGAPTQMPGAAPAPSGMPAPGAPVAPAPTAAPAPGGAPAPTIPGSAVPGAQPPAPSAAPGTASPGSAGAPPAPYYGAMQPGQGGQ
jgi:hypothetical protein